MRTLYTIFYIKSTKNDKKGRRTTLKEVNYIKSTISMMRLPTKKRLRKAKEKPEKPEFSRLFGHGAGDGI